MKEKGLSREVVSTVLHGGVHIYHQPSATHESGNTNKMKKLYATGLTRGPARWGTSCRVHSPTCPEALRRSTRPPDTCSL